MPTHRAPPPAVILERPFRKTAAFGLLATIQVMLILAITVIAIGLPAIAAELRLRPGQLALVSAGYGLAFSGLLLFGGRMADLLGQRRMLVAGLAGFGVASVAAGLAPSFWPLLLARLGQGAGAALAAPAAMALLGSVFPDRGRHARALALWGGLAPIGATAGILLSGVAATWASWRWGFALPAAVALVAIAGTGRLLPAGDPPMPTRLDLPGAVLVTIGVTAGSYGLVTAGDRGWHAPGVTLTLLAGAAALAGFVAVEARTRSPLVPLRLLRSPRRMAGLAAVMVVAAGHASIGFFLALYLQQIRGASAIATTAAFLPFLLLLPPAGWLAARLLSRFRPQVVAAVGLLTATVGLLLIAPLGVDTRYAGTLLAGLLVFPVGAGLTFAAATVAAVEGTGRSQAGLAGGMVNTAVELGPAVGLAVLVGLAGSHTARLLDAGRDVAAATSSGYEFALTTAAAGFAVAGLAIAITGLRRPNRAAG